MKLFLIAQKLNIWQPLLWDDIYTRNRPPFWVGASRKCLSAPFVLSFCNLQIEVSHNGVPLKAIDLSQLWVGWGGGENYPTMSIIFYTTLKTCLIEHLTTRLFGTFEHCSKNVVFVCGEGVGYHTEWNFGLGYDIGVW